MMMVALYMRPWLSLMETAGVEGRVLADDILIITGGEGMLHRFGRALQLTHTYMDDAGAKVAPDKSYNFASNETAAEWLRKTTWATIKSKIKVVRDFRYVGAHLNTMRVRKAATLDARFHKGVGMLRRLKNLHIDIADKAKAIRTVVYPATLYGIEAARTTRTKVGILAAAVKDVLYSKNDRHDTDWLFANGVNGKDLDPEVQIFIKRMTMLRRAVEKKPSLKAKVQSIYRAYKKEAEEDTSAHWQKDGCDSEEEWCPWPHACSPCKPPASATVHPRGPVGLIIEEMVRLDAHMDEDFTLTIPKEQPIPMLAVPFS